MVAGEEVSVAGDAFRFLMDRYMEENVPQDPAGVFLKQAVRGRLAPKPRVDVAATSSTVKASAAIAAPTARRGRKSAAAIEAAVVVKRRGGRPKVV